MQPKILVIGVGNPLREDDGLGARVVAILSEKLPPPVREQVALKADHQIDLVQAAVIKDYDCVIYVDAKAGMDPPAVQRQRIEPADERPAFSSHIGSLPALLSVTLKVFGKAPDCYLVAVQGSSFDFNQGLSDEGKSHAALGAQEVIALIGELT